VSGKVILQVSIAVFSGAVKKIFGQRWLSPLAKLARTPMRELSLHEGIFAMLMQNTNCINLYHFTILGQYIAMGHVYYCANSGLPILPIIYKNCNHFI